MTLYNPTSGIGQVISSAMGVTGSVFLTLFFLSMLIMALILICKIPLELSMIFILPLHLVILSYYGDWLSVAGSFLIYSGIILAKNFLIT